MKKNSFRKKYICIIYLLLLLLILVVGLFTRSFSNTKEHWNKNFNDVEKNDNMLKENVENDFNKDVEEKNDDSSRKETNDSNNSQKDNSFNPNNNSKKDNDYIEVEKSENNNDKKDNNHIEVEKLEDNNGKKDDINNDEHISVIDITLNISNLELYVGETKIIKEEINPSNATNKTVRWYSTNPDVATVQEGTITANSKGKTSIIVETEDGNYSANCSVNVISKPIEVSSDIHFEKKCKNGDSGSFCTKGISASINPTGGSGEYISYSLKLYRNSILIEESNSKSLWTNLYTFGEFYLIYYVKDSEGNEIKGTSSIYTINN